MKDANDSLDVVILVLVIVVIWRLLPLQKAVPVIDAVRTWLTKLGYIQGA